MPAQVVEPSGQGFVHRVLHAAASAKPLLDGVQDPGGGRLEMAAQVDLDDQAEVADHRERALIQDDLVGAGGRDLEPIDVRDDELDGLRA